ncbi:Hypothetical protein, putative, partial [Bodo saltans]
WFRRHRGLWAGRERLVTPSQLRWYIAPPLSCTSTNNASLKNLRVFPFSYGITSSYFSRHVTKRKLLDWNPILVNDSESHVETPYYFRFTKAEVSAISLWTYVLNFVAPGDIHADEFDEEEHRKLSIQLLDVSRESLSCASVMKSLFVRSGFAALDSLPRSIIFISFPHTDYITYTVECGLDELGLNYTVNYRFGTAYSDEDDNMMRPTHRNPNFTLTRATGGLLIREVLRRKTIKNYGLGFASAQKLSLPPNPIPASQEALCRQILDGWHDFYIIAWKSDAFLRDSCFEEAMRILGPDRVVIVEGEDQEFLPNMTKYALRGVRIFSRESRCELFE